MGILKSMVQFTGSLDNLSFYTVSGSDKIIVRRKGGPSREQIKKEPRFEKTRLNASEFAGRVLGSKMILRGVHPLRTIFDYNVALALHKPLRAIQVLDSSSSRGKRGIGFSRKPSFIDGLNLNRRNSLDSVIRTPLEYSVTPEGRALVHVPELVPDVNLILSEKYPYYRLVVVLAALPDVHMKGERYSSAVPGLSFTRFTDHTTPWVSVRSRNPESAFELSYPMPGSDACVWMLSFGLELGVPSESDDITPVRRQGAGKILKLLRVGTVHGNPVTGTIS